MFPFTVFRWIGPYILENVLPNRYYLLSKIGRKRTQMFQRMRLRQFTYQQPRRKETQF